jgi:hypothetical protein
MIISAKFASFCPCCNARIEVGSKVEWSKGSKARHVACAGGASPKAATGRRGYVGTSGRTYSSALERYRAGDASARSYGWDGVRGSASYYTSGAYDDES